MEYVSIYLDESGDLGFDFDNRGTPKHFIITLLYCENTAAAKMIATSVKRTLRRKLQAKKRRSIELKGSDTKLEIKEYFYRHIERIDGWNLYGIALDKHQLINDLPWLPSEQRIYNFLSKEILKEINLASITADLQLIVDKRKGRKGINEFNKYLSTHLEATLPLNVSFDISHEQSHENPLLQATDLFCWGIRRSYEYQDDAWFSVYKDRTTLVKLDTFSGIKKDGP